MSWADEPRCENHRWRWVQTWHDRGFRECWLCGFCGPVTSSLAPVESVEIVESVDPVVDMNRPAAAPGRQRSRPTRAAAAMRFDAVTAELRNGVKPEAIAAQFSISRARVYQIRSAWLAQQVTA